MGNTLHFLVCCRTQRPLKVYNILLLGLSGSGKTEIGTKLTGKTRRDFSSTNGVRGFKKFCGNDVINFTEVGGNEEMRKIWHHYYVKAMGVIFTIDISDYTSLSHSLNALTEVLQHKYMSGKPFAVLATKADLTDEVDIIDLNETFGLECIANRFQSHMLLLSIGLSDMPELLEAVQWLKNRIDEQYQKILNRIIFDKEDARHESIPVLHHSGQKFLRNARVALHRMGSLLVSLERPRSAPALTNNRRSSPTGSAFTCRGRKHRVASAQPLPNRTKRVRFEKRESEQMQGKCATPS